MHSQREGAAGAVFFFAAIPNRLKSLKLAIALVVEPKLPAPKPKACKENQQRTSDYTLINVNGEVLLAYCGFAIPNAQQDKGQGPMKRA